MTTYDFDYIYNNSFPAFPCPRELISKLKCAPVLSHNPVTIPRGPSIAVQRSGLCFHQIRTYISKRRHQEEMCSHKR